MGYQIITDGSCDLGESIAKERQIEVVPFYVSFDDKIYRKEIEEIAVSDFYQQMVDRPKEFPKSSMPNIPDYIEVFKKYTEQRIPIICICITSKFSGSYSSACSARDMILEGCPDAQITVIDSSVNTVLQGILVLEAVKMQQAGYGFEDTVKQIEAIKSTGRIFFTIGTMDYLVHGGRVGKLIGLAGSTLGIKPLITLKEGEIFPSGIARSRKKSMMKVISMVKEHFHKIGESPDEYTIVVGYGYDYKEAEEFRKSLLLSLSEYSNITEVDIYQIGATIGVHTGPYPIGVGIIKKVLN